MNSGSVMYDFPVVHAVTDSAAVHHVDFLARAAAIMQALGPRGAVHLRSSRISGRRFYDLAVALAAMQEQTGCWLIVNDRIDVALGVGARGAQLASHSLSIPDAILVAGTLPLGASVHSVEEAVEAATAGASWCVAGTVFETPSHAGRPPARLKFVEDVAGAVSIPVIAIGGVKPEDVVPLRHAGAYGVATIRGAVWEVSDHASDHARPRMETQLAQAVPTAFPEPVTRYISAYDSESGSERDDHADGQRRSTGAGAE